MKIMKQFQNKKVMSAVLAVTMAVTGIQAPVLAAENHTENTDKVEVVYVNLNHDGTVTEINVVNILKPDSTGAIVDYGDYESVRNMTTTDALDYSGDTVKINTDADKLYYEGKLKSTVMPWNVSIHYYMDGKEYSADEIAGMSGQLKMTMKITENKNYEGNFYDAYALQASVTLDTDQCKNIDAPDAAIANVGKNKQLTYTILPGKGADLTITADVTDFEMDDIAVNGIPLSLNIDIDDDELMDQVIELQDGIADADDGAGELKDGTDTLTSGTSSLASGAETLDNGVQSLNEGIEQIQAGLDALDAKSGELTDGSAQMRQALAQLQAALDSVSASAEDVQKLTAASSRIKTGIDDLSAGADQLAVSASYEAYKQAMADNGLDIGVIKAGNTEAISSIQAMVDKADALEAKLEKLGISTDAITPIKEQCEELASQMQTLLKGNNAAIAGTEAYMNELHAGAQELAKGAAELKKNYTTFNAAVGELADNLTGLIYNMSELKDAVNELAAEYGKLDDGLNAYTEGVASVNQGYSKLSKGVVSLASGSQSLYSGAKTLAEGVDTLYDGTVELKDGMSEMRDKTSDMDTKITDQIDDMLDSMTGKNVKTGSFVSEKDTNVEKVQFVIKTDSIEKPEEQETVQTEEVQESLWQKLTDLFKK